MRSGTVRRCAAQPVDLVNYVAFGSSEVLVVTLRLSETKAEFSSAHVATVSRRLWTIGKYLVQP